MLMTAWTPSGQQWPLRYGDQRATVVEVGGGVREYTVGGRAVLDGYPVDAMCSSGRGATLAPWPNRLRDGRYTFDGQSQQLALSEPAKGNAIHGLVRWLPWTLDDRTDSSVTVRVTVLPQTGYPYGLQLRNAYTLDDSGLTLTTTATNIGPVALPYGVGFHPYLTLGAATVDDDVLTVPGTTWIAVDARSLPNGAAPVDGTEYDYRAPRRIGDAVLDTAFTDLVRDNNGVAAVTLGTADGTSEISLWADASFPYLQVFTGDTLKGADRRRGLAVEPMTCPPDAFNSGDGLVRIEPGDAHITRWGLTTRGF
ncbi:aldose 1-epimerase family protein [Acidothermaceae bacterium B102]|nr:aldose 1-epimerase family protein [Acidothermaceae bacterium B102]